jgi:hypothetical protein
MTRLRDTVDRLKATLARKTRSPDDVFEPIMIRVRGGITGTPLTATIADRRIERFSGECEADFVERAFELAHELRAQYIVVGGLPRSEGK